MEPPRGRPHNASSAKPTNQRGSVTRTSAMKALREGLRPVAGAPAHAWPPFSLLLAADLAGASALRRESPPAPLLPDTGRRHALSSQRGARLAGGKRASWCCPTPPDQIRTRAAPPTVKHTVQQLLAPNGAGMLEGWPVPAPACLPWTPEGSAQRQRGLGHDHSAGLRQGRQRKERGPGKGSSSHSFTPNSASVQLAQSNHRRQR